MPNIGLQFKSKKILPSGFTAPDALVPYTSIGYSCGRGKSILVNKPISGSSKVRKKEMMKICSEDKVNNILSGNNIVIGYSNYDSNDNLIDPMLTAFNGSKSIHLGDIANTEMNSPSWLDILKWIDKQIKAPMYFFEGLDVTENTALICIGT